MAQLDDIVGSVMKKLEDDGRRRTTRSSSSPPTTAPRTSPGPTAARRRSPAARAPCSRAASASRASSAGRARCRPARSRTASSRGSTGSRPSSRAAGNPNIVDELKKGKQLGDQTYKVHLDGYDQTDLITGKGPSKRHEIFYFAEGTLGAVRIDDYKYRFIDQPSGWLGGTVKVDWPHPRQPSPRPVRADGPGTGRSTPTTGSSYEFWRFVFVKQEVAKYAQTFVEFPPMQEGASFNLEHLKNELEKKEASRQAQ